MSLAQETARKGITVNSVAPGYISTEMVEAVPKEALDKVIAKIPVGRLGEPDEIARVVEFLADPDSASSPARSTPSTAASTCEAYNPPHGRGPLRAGASDGEALMQHPTQLKRSARRTCSRGQAAACPTA